jgi:hypothetical protein
MSFNKMMYGNRVLENYRNFGKAILVYDMMLQNGGCMK